MCDHWNASKPAWLASQHWTKQILARETRKLVYNGAFNTKISFSPAELSTKDLESDNGNSKEEEIQGLEDEDPNTESISTEVTEKPSCDDEEENLELLSKELVASVLVQAVKDLTKQKEQILALQTNELVASVLAEALKDIQSGQS